MRTLMGMTPGICLSRPGLPSRWGAQSALPLTAFVANVPGKDRQSLAFSRCPGRLMFRRCVAARLGRLRVPLPQITRVRACSLR